MAVLNHQKAYDPDPLGVAAAASINQAYEHSATPGEMRALYLFKQRVECPAFNQLPHINQARLLYQNMEMEGAFKVLNSTAPLVIYTEPGAMYGAIANYANGGAGAIPVRSSRAAANLTNSTGVISNTSVAGCVAEDESPLAIVASVLLSVVILILFVFAIIIINRILQRRIHHVLHINDGLVAKLQ
jgi:hypothetical protein